MNKYKKLFDNSIIFTIGNFGSKIISILMVPLYTSKLSTQQYGMIDLISTTINLLIPLLTFEIGQGVLRYVIEMKSIKNRNILFSTSFVHLIILSIAIIIIGPFIISNTYFKEFSIYFLLLLVFMIQNLYFQNLIRGLGFTKEFAINGVLTTLFIVILNIISLIWLNLGIEGYLISLIISYFLSNIYLYYTSKKLLEFKFSLYDKLTLKMIFEYSIPLMPNGIMWWLINGSTRYIILFFLGTSVNGLFAVATKLPNLITTISNIFMQAWQLSSFEEYESSDKDMFYSNVFNVLSLVLFISGSTLLIILKPIIGEFISTNYFNSWKMVPALIFGVIFQCLSGFLGTNYTAAKQTIGAFTTSIIGGVSSLIINYFFIKYGGANYTGIGTALSFLIMFIYRYFDTKKYVDIRFNYVTFITSLILLILQVISLFIFNSWLSICFGVLFLLLIIIINKHYFEVVIKSIYSIIPKK